jgi:ectoine hydroxylase-related dioxygenase (phytanoyl-CoA dioxygenase family)
LFRIPARKGSFIIWDSRTAHGNWPNQRSVEWRKVCYMTFYPQPKQLDMRKRIHDKFEHMLPDHSKKVLTLEGKRIYGLEAYPEDDDKEKREKGEPEKRWSVDMDAYYSFFLYV